MIDSIIVGRGTNRKAIPLVRDRTERQSLTRAINSFLFPTVAANQQALARGNRRAAAYRRDRREAAAA